MKPLEVWKGWHPQTLVEGEGICQGSPRDISEVDSRKIKQTSLFLENNMGDSPDSKFHVFAEVSSFTLDSLK